MRKCSTREVNFCLAYLELHDAGAAYLEAYDTKSNKDVARRRGYEVLQRAHVQAQLLEYRLPVIQKVQDSLESHVQRLAQLRDWSIAEGDRTNAVRCEVAIGKALGHYGRDLSELGSDTYGVVWIPARAESTQEWIAQHRPKELPPLPPADG